MVEMLLVILEWVLYLSDFVSQCLRFVIRDFFDKNGTQKTIAWDKIP